MTRRRKTLCAGGVGTPTTYVVADPQRVSAQAGEWPSGGLRDVGRLNTIQQIADDFGGTRPTIYRHLARQTG